MAEYAFTPRYRPVVHSTAAVTLFAFTVASLLGLQARRAVFFGAGGLGAVLTVLLYLQSVRFREIRWDEERVAVDRYLLPNRTVPREVVEVVDGGGLLLDGIFVPWHLLENDGRFRARLGAHGRFATASDRPVPRLNVTKPLGVIAGFLLWRGSLLTGSVPGVASPRVWAVVCVVGGFLVVHRGINWLLGRSSSRISV